MRLVRNARNKTQFRLRDDKMQQGALTVCALVELLMRHEVPLRNNHNGLTKQRLGNPTASKSHHSTPKDMRINCKSQACLPVYTSADRRAPRLFRPQKSSIAVVRHRSVLGVREDGSRTGSAIFVAKKRRKQPHVNQT